MQSLLQPDYFTTKLMYGIHHSVYIFLGPLLLFVTTRLPVLIYSGRTGFRSRDVAVFIYSSLLLLPSIRKNNRGL
jgi:hypothetical protein